ncbi:MAG: galactitol-1-phosphate 5-dehydrogenase [Lachnospiraceae bacterium]|nr:galactitol-1-phosphate 5-dehydrogenase [Lachnospiraceae bacterium]
MKALVLEDIGKLEYKEVETSEPKKGEALVRVMAAGICGSDIPRAYRDGAHNMPLIIGHEFAGIVEKVGEGVSSDLTGKRVGVFPLIPCGCCGPCRNRQYEMCRSYSYLGSRRDGGFAQFVTVPVWNLIELPSNVSYEAVAMLEPMAVAVHAIRRIFDHQEISTDSCIAVCGLGTIGTLLVMFLLEKGYKNLLVIGNKEFQKKTMLDLGISGNNYCDSGKENAHDFIMEHTKENGADVFFECVGSNEVARLAVDCAAPAGSVCFVGNPHSDMTFEKNVYWKILRNQLRVTGTWNSSFLGADATDDDWHYVLSRLESGSIHPEKLITQRFKLDEIYKGFEIMRDKTEDYVKVMCVMDLS